MATIEGQGGAAQALGLSPVHISPNQGRGASITWHDGGRLLSLHRPTRKPGRGGKRGTVKGFSSASRRRLMRFLASLDSERMGSPWFCTLTYPKPFCLAGEEWKRDLDRFAKWLRRQKWFGACLWKLEPQKRGAPHFHLLAFLDPQFVELLGGGLVAPSLPWRRKRRAGGCHAEAWLQDAIAWRWHLAVGCGDSRHLEAGTQVQRVESWRGVMFYAGKYVAKPAESVPDEFSGAWEAAGRWWGKWGEWASQPVRADVDDAEFFRVRRVLARFVGRQTGRKWRLMGQGGLTAFVEAGTSERLLEWAAGTLSPMGSFRALAESERQLPFVWALAANERWRERMDEERRAFYRWEDEQRHG